LKGYQAKKTRKLLLNKIFKLMEKTPWHFTQAFNILAAENDLDFFDVNLKYDSPLFFDPSLLRRSKIEKEQGLYSRFTKYFDAALKKALASGGNSVLESMLYKFLSFPEPKEVCLGFTENSTDGRGLSKVFAQALYDFFMSDLASRLVADKGMYQNGEINPEIFAAFANKVDLDGISDLSINLLMDYLADYTKEQCVKYDVPCLHLHVGQSFDFETMTWTGGFVAELPENPFRPGEPVILVPKRFLRQKENSADNLKRRTVAILDEDPNLRLNFANILSKPLKEISVEEIREILLSSDLALRTFVKKMEDEAKHPYDFIEDVLQLLAFKKYRDYFDKVTLAIGPRNGEELFDHVKTLIDVFKQEEELKGGWKDAWHLDRNENEVEVGEVTWGRKFRAMGMAYFCHFPEVLFDPEIELGDGRIDFRVAYMEHKVLIELKKLSNNSPKGDDGDKIASYKHGILRQLPRYIESAGSQYGVYLTGQHHKRSNFSKTDHSGRVLEIQQLVPVVKKQLTDKNKDFKELLYVNVDLSKRSSVSNT
jgi:hypothetical protein